MLAGAVGKAFANALPEVTKIPHHHWLHGTSARVRTQTSAIKTPNWQQQQQRGKETPWAKQYLESFQKTEQTRQKS
jgi:hypothetical protein